MVRESRPYASDIDTTCKSGIFFSHPASGFAKGARRETFWGLALE